MPSDGIPDVINIEEKLGKFDSLWTPKIIAQMNDYFVKLVKLEDEFVWHSHPETDELFFVINGRLRIEYRNGATDLEPGEMIIVPRGVEHRPVAESGCEVMLIEPIDTVNTGDAGGDRTVNTMDWI